MRTLTNPNTDRLLNEFIDDLLRTPITNDRFTASFTRTGACHGELLFQHTCSNREAVIEWEAYRDLQKVCGVLKYNHTFVLLRAGSDDFKDKIARTLPVF